MKAMIFAAGIGSRLRPFTDHHPKALLPVGGKPMLQRVLENVATAGVAEVVVNVHHFARQVVDFINLGLNLPLRVAVSDESDILLDTGGGLLKAAPLLLPLHGEPVILHNADILTDLDLKTMADEHRRSGADVTLLVSKRSSSRMLYFDGDGSLAGWQNCRTGEMKPTPFVPADFRAGAFGGVHVVSESVFPLLEEYSREHGSLFSIIPFYLENLHRLKIRAYEPASAYLWHDVGSPEKAATAEAALEKKP